MIQEERQREHLGGETGKRLPGNSKKQGGSFCEVCACLRVVGKRIVKSVKRGFSRVKAEATIFLNVLFMDHLHENHLGYLFQRSILDPPLTCKVRICMRRTLLFGILTCPLH